MIYEKGTPVYEPELRELMDRLKARGICLVVIGGNRNKNDAEFSIAVRGDDVPLLCMSMLKTVSDLVKMTKDVPSQN